MRSFIKWIYRMVMENLKAVMKWEDCGRFTEYYVDFYNHLDGKVKNIHRVV